MNKRTYSLLLSILLVLLLAIAGCSSDDDSEPESAPEEPETAAADASESDDDSETRGLLLEQPMPAPDFELTDHEGNPFKLSDHEGRVAAIFFGYTHCPDICPLTIMHMQDAAQDLGDDANDAMFLFVTVDPEQDSPEQMAKYVDRADAEIIGLTGERDELEEIWDAYDITVEIREREDGSYLVDHSAQTWMLNQQGEAALILPPSADGDDMAHDIRWLLNRSS